MDITKNDSGISTALGFRATKNDDGSLTIHNVPIFVRCKRGEHDFNEAWIDKAVAASKLAEGEGYLPPLHIRHHAPGADEAVRAVGVFRLIGKAPIIFKGSTKPGILADLIVTCPSAQREVLEKRLPYRSVEIFNVDNPRIDGLALLDHEAPFLELPMLVVNKVTGGAQTAAEAVGVAGATFASDWQMDAGVNADGVVACFRRGQTAHFLLETEAMTPEQIAAADAEAKRVALADSGEGDKPSAKPDDKSEQAEGDEGGGSIDAKGCAKAIASGTISLADFQMIKDAMAEAEAAAGGEAEETPADVAPAATPGEAMSKITAEAFAKLQGENEANRAAIVKMQADTQRTSDIDAAMEKLEGKPLGADLRTRLTAFHADHGQKAFLSYVAGLDTTTGIAPDTARGADAFGGSAGAGIPEVAMKYESKGADAVEKAAVFAREWKTLHDSGHTRMAEDRYVSVNMERSA